MITGQIWLGSIIFKFRLHSKEEKKTDWPSWRRKNEKSLSGYFYDINKKNQSKIRWFILFLIIYKSSKIRIIEGLFFDSFSWLCDFFLHYLFFIYLYSFCFSINSSKCAKYLLSSSLVWAYKKLGEKVGGWEDAIT